MFDAGGDGPADDGPVGDHRGSAGPIERDLDAHRVNAHRVDAQRVDVDRPLPDANTARRLEEFESAARLVLDDLWAGLLDLARREAAAESFLVWLGQIQPQRIDRGTLYVLCRGRLPVAYLRDRYTSLLERLVQRSHGVALRVRVELDDTLGGVLRNWRPVARATEANRTARRGTASQPLARTPAIPAPAPYLVVTETRTAHEALRVLADGDAESVAVRGSGLLTLVGGQDTGKTHLVDVFVHRRQHRCPQERWWRRSALSLFREYALACRERRIGEFRGQTLAHDGLVIEDLHELGAKLQFQEFLAQVFEYFRERRRPVLLTLRELPGAGREFLHSFRSQVVAGWTLRIPAFQSESRREILAHRASARTVPDWLLEHLAETPRTLDECLDFCRAVRAEGLEQGRAASRRELETRHPEWFVAEHPPEPMDRILDLCAEWSGAERDAIVRGDRTRGAALGRHLAIYVALEIVRLRRSTVRRWLGRLSPSVVPYARRRIETARSEQPELESFLRRAAEELLHGQRFLF